MLIYNISSIQQNALSTHTHACTHTHTYIHSFSDSTIGYYKILNIVTYATEYNQ